MWSLGGASPKRPLRSSQPGILRGLPRRVPSETPPKVPSSGPWTPRLRLLDLQQHVSPTVCPGRGGKARMPPLLSGASPWSSEAPVGRPLHQNPHLWPSTHVAAARNLHPTPSSRGSSTSAGSPLLPYTVPTLRQRPGTSCASRRGPCFPSEQLFFLGVVAEKPRAGL